MASKTVVCVNVLNNISSLVYGSHCQEWFRMGRAYPDDDFILYHPFRSSIDRTRNEAVRIALDQECEYLYFVDDDMILAPNTYKKLRELDEDIVMARTVVRGYPFDNMYFIDPDDKDFKTDRPVAESLIHFNEHPEEGLTAVRVDAIGCACVLFKVELFKDLEPPWFVTMPGLTEDVYCCLKLQKKFGRQNVGIYVHLECGTGHMMDAEIAHPDNKHKLRKRFEEDYPNVVRIDQSADRGDSYRGMVEEAFK